MPQGALLPLTRQPFRSQLYLSLRGPRVIRWENPPSSGRSACGRENGNVRRHKQFLPCLTNVCEFLVHQERGSESRDAAAGFA